MDAKKFLRQKGLISKGNRDLIIKNDKGEYSLVSLLIEYTKSIESECVHPYAFLMGEEDSLPECRLCGKKLY